MFFMLAVRNADGVEALVQDGAKAEAVAGLCNRVSE